MKIRFVVLAVMLGILAAGAAQASFLDEFFGRPALAPLAPLMQPTCPDILGRVRALPQPELVGAPTNGWLIAEKPLILQVVWCDANGYRVRQPVKGHFTVFVEKTDEVGVNFVSHGIQLCPRHLGLSSWVTAIFQSDEDPQLAWSYSFLASFPRHLTDRELLMQLNTQLQSQSNSNSSNSTNRNGVENNTNIGIVNDNATAAGN